MSPPMINTSKNYLVMTMIDAGDGAAITTR